MRNFEHMQPPPTCWGSCELDINRSSCWLNFRTHNHLFHDDNPKVQCFFALIASWVHQTDHDMPKTTLINPITLGQDMQMVNSS